MQNSSLWGLDKDKDFENSILTSLTPVIENELTKNVLESSVLTEIGSATNSANISEPDLFNFLKKYDIEDVYTFLEGKHLTLESLRYLNDFDLKELIPLSHLGLRIKLRRQLTHWKLTEFGEGNLTNTTLTASSKVQEWINTVEVNEPEGHNKENLNNISVQEILNADSHGKHVLKTRRLNPDSRLKISRIIVDYFILENIILRKSDFQRLAIDICSCFPEETQDYYYTPGGVKKRQGGALYFRYINSRHKLKLKSPEPQSGASETQSSTSVQEIDETIGENIKKWLQFNLDEYQEILEKWEASFEYRRREIIKYSSNAEYFQQWPVLKSINGSKLLLIDFNLLYPDHENCLFNKWDLFKEKIIPYLQENLKDKQNLKLFVESKSQTENTQNYMLCNLLNAVLTPTARYNSTNSSHTKKKHKYTIKQGQDSFALQISNINDYQIAIENLRKQCANEKSTLQPTIIVVDSEKGIKEQYIYLDGVTFKYTSFMAFRISTWYIILTIIPLIFSRTPDETSPPSVPTDIYQLLAPPSSTPGDPNANQGEIPENQNQHPYLHQKSFNNINDQDSSKNSQNINNAQNVNSITKQHTTTTTTPAPPSTKRCFYRGREDCPKSRDNCRCRRLAENSSEVVCCDVTSEFLLKEGLTCANVGITDDVTELHIRNATLPELNLTLTNFRRLKSLSITDGRIGKVVGMFLPHTPICCLNLSSNGLQYIEQRGITSLGKLVILDLSNNNLTALPNLKQNANIVLDISANNEMPCQFLMNARSNYTNLDFLNPNSTYCTISKNFHWFNSTSLVPFKQVQEFYVAQNKCWTNCKCEFYRMDYVEGKVPTLAFKVDCAGINLTEMPSDLPKNTIVLNISNNNISILKMDNESFGNIRELYADNNQIKSILSLEGTKFLDNFVALSLRNNTLKTLPSYMLSHIFDRNVNSRHVHFGNNRLHCDCNTAKNLRVWLLTKEKIILDYDEIYCENTPQKVIYLDPASMCQDSKQSWTDYIYYIITAEVLLLVCLVLKVSYDYWVFKTAGYLPWPANKMPKLPCDWLCE